MLMGCRAIKKRLISHETLKERLKERGGKVDREEPPPVPVGCALFFFFQFVYSGHLVGDFLELFLYHLHGEESELLK